MCLEALSKKMTANLACASTLTTMTPVLIHQLPRRDNLIKLTRTTSLPHFDKVSNS